MWIALLVVCACLYLLVMSLFNRIGPMLSNPAARTQANQALVSIISDQAASNPIKIAELGSGWGGWVQSMQSVLTNHASEIEIHAFETNAIPYLYHRLINCLTRQSTQIHFKNFLADPLDQYLIWVCYLCPSLMKKLEQKREQLQHPPLLISICFALPNTTPTQTLICNDWQRTRIYVYNQKYSSARDLLNRSGYRFSEK